MKDILTQVQAGKLSVEKALKMLEEMKISYPHPTAVCKILPEAGIVVDLHNWEGVSPTKIELMQHRMVVASQQYRAKRLQEMRIEESRNVA